MTEKRILDRNFLGFAGPEKGAVSVLAIMVLLLLTIAGIASLFTAQTEIQIAANERDYVKALTRSDGALNLSSQLLTTSSIDSELLNANSAPDDWIVTGSLSDAKDVMRRAIMKFLTADPRTGPTDTATASDMGVNTYYSAIDWGRARGSSLDVTEQKPLKEYTLYGIYSEDLGSLDPNGPDSSNRSANRSLVEAGYRNR